MIRIMFPVITAKMNTLVVKATDGGEEEEESLAQLENHSPTVEDS